MSEPIRTAVIGYGTAGRVFHAPLIEADPAFELAAIVTASPERTTAATARYPNARIVGTAEELFAASDSFDLVVIATPNETHSPLALSAIEHGLNVVLDKPVAVTSDEATSVVSAAVAAGVQLTVFQNRRWDGDFLTLRKAIADGKLGEVCQFDSAFEWWSPGITQRWKDTAAPNQGGGMLYDIGPHLIDQAIQLFGPVADVHAELDTRRPGAVADDDSFLSLTHECGVRSRLWMSAISPKPRPRFRVVSADSALTICGLDPQEAQLDRGSRPGDGGYGLDDQRRALLTGIDSTVELPILAGDYPEFYRQLSESILSDGPGPVDPHDSIDVLALIERALRTS